MTKRFAQLFAAGFAVGTMLIMATAAARADTGALAAPAIAAHR